MLQSMWQNKVCFSYENREMFLEDIDLELYLLDLYQYIQRKLQLKIIDILFGVSSIPFILLRFCFVSLLSVVPSRSIHSGGY